MKRVLFVDDEPALLDGLRGRLRGMRSRWEMVFVESGSRAIAEIEQAPFDVVVSDMRMPVMDGVQLLASVAERWPATIRVVLSGHAQEEQSARLLTTAHQYLSKPCGAEQLESVIDRCLKLHELLTEPRLRSVVGRVKNLPALPQAYARLSALMADPGASINDVAKAISADAVVSAKVLQMVNSSFFRLARRISRIDQAVNYLGFAAIRNIVMSLEVFSRWRNDPALPDFAPERLQARAQRVAAAAWALSTGTPVADDALLAGLLHNIGYWVLLQECPEDVVRAVAVARAEGISLPAAERQVIGASHAEIGAYLLGIWGLPYSVVEAVAFQHMPTQVAAAGLDALAVLVIAESLTMAEAPLVADVLARDCAIDESFLRRLTLPFDWQEARRRVLETGEPS